MVWKFISIFFYFRGNGNSQVPKTHCRTERRRAWIDGDGSCVWIRDAWTWIRGACDGDRHAFPSLPRLQRRKPYHYRYWQAEEEEERQRKQQGGLPPYLQHLLSIHCLLESQPRRRLHRGHHRGAICDGGTSCSFHPGRTWLPCRNTHAARHTPCILRSTLLKVRLRA